MTNENSEYFFWWSSREGRKNGQNVVRRKKKKQCTTNYHKHRISIVPSPIAPRSLSPRIPKTIDGYCGRVVADGERKRSLRRSCFVDFGTHSQQIPKENMCKLDGNKRSLVLPENFARWILTVSYPVGIWKYTIEFVLVNLICFEW